MINKQTYRFANSNQIAVRPTNLNQISARITTQDRIANLTDRDLFNLCQQCGANIRKFQREFACYLPEVEKRRLYKHHHCHTLYEFAAKLAGMTKETVDEILKVHQKLADKQMLINLMMEQGWGKLRIVASIATVETQEFWVEKVREMSKMTLQTFVNELKKQATARANELPTELENSLPNENAGLMDGQTISSTEVSAPIHIAQQFDLFGDENSRTGSGKPMEISQKTAMTFKLDDEAETKLKIFKHRLEKKTKELQDWNQTIKELLKIVEQHESCTKPKAQQTPEPIRQKKIAEKDARPQEQETREITKDEIQKSLPACDKRYIPACVRRYLEQKYHGKCGFPNCKNPSEITHHTRRFSLKPNHDPDFIVPLCKPHERLAHHGLIQNEESSPEKWQIKLNPNKNSPKHAIDRIVQQFRMPTK